MAYTTGQIGLAIKRLQVRNHRAMEARLTPLGLTVAQWDALRHLRQNPDASLHELAVLTFQTDQSMGTLATRMIARNLIERVDGPGRAVRHRMTPDGARLLEAAGREVDQTLADSFGGISASQLATLGTALERILGPDMPAEGSAGEG
jgi:DNA-binding MarR family transcriptional regulator